MPVRRLTRLAVRVGLIGWAGMLVVAPARSHSTAPSPAPNSAPVSSSDTANPGTHHHATLEIPANQPVPQVMLVVHPDRVRGVNLEVIVKNFRFAPEQVNQKSLSTEGHAHLYVDGQKVTRLYGSWYYLGDLAPGKHTLKVTLNSNGHEELTHKGEKIHAIQVVEIPAGR